MTRKLSDSLGYAKVREAARYAGVFVLLAGQRTLTDFDAKITPSVTSRQEKNDSTA